MDVHSGATIAGRYELVQQIGAGGMGQVWRATDTVLGRDVAIKLLDVAAATDASAEARFAQEARATAALNSPNVVTVHDSGVEDGTAYLVMELLPGPSLAADLARGPRPVGEVETVARDVLSGLGIAHERGLIHRDIKPANVMRAADGNWRVVDFGISRLVDAGGGGPTQALTATHMIIGTADYLAPEQALGQPLDARTDLFAVGLLLWTLLVGRPPLSAATPIATMMRHANEDVPDVRSERPDVPAGLAGLIDSLTARDPARRPVSAGAALALLQGAPRDAAATEVLSAGAGATAVLPAAGRTERIPTAPRPRAPQTRPAPREAAPAAGSWDQQEVDRDRRWGPRLVGVLVALIVGALLWNWASNRDWGGATHPGDNPSASASAPTEVAPPASPSPSVTPSATPTPTPSSLSPSATPSASDTGAAAVSGAMGAFTAAVSAAEKLGGIDKDAGKSLAAASRDMDKAVRSGSSSNAESDVQKLREAYDKAADKGGIEEGTRATLDPLIKAVESAVSAWAAMG